MSNEELIAFLKKNVIAVSCVLASIAIVVVIYLRSDELPDTEKVFNDNSQQAALLQANIEDSEHLEEQHASVVASVDKMNDRMIHVGQLAENLQYFYKLESDTGAKLEPRQVPWIPPSPNAPKTTYTPVTFSLTAQGTYAQELDLLRRLEGGEHYCRILTCNIHPIGEGRGGAILMSLTIELLGIQ
jgi:hypothetical protein